MQIVKLYWKRKPHQPEFLKLERVENGDLLVVYPISSPDSKRNARWVNPNDVHIEWIKTFEGV